ncbi:shufflon system plasmid conjugative transfer pilus tip adhesin PilV [Escherichia coli]|nr:shufflon system plasmid conjugative transfer pilus tip adhesin PilV [Escherichia coli]
MKKGVAQIMDAAIGIGIFLMVLAVIIIPLSNLIIDQTRATIAASHAKRVQQAVNTYIKENHDWIAASTTATTPLIFGVPELISAGYLPSGFSAQNGFSATYQTRVFKPSANKLNSMTFLNGGVKLEKSLARKIAIGIGADGGIIDNNLAQGALGSWTINLSTFGGYNPGEGSVVIAGFYEDGISINDYLYRKSVPGKPELNTMSTALNMGGNDINNAKSIGANSITATGAIQAGGNIASNGTITGGAVNSTGNMTAAGTLTATTTNTAGETYTGGWFRTRGDSGWYSEKWGGGFYMSDSAWIRAYADKSIYTGGVVQAGQIQSNGRMTANEYIQINGVATLGWGCAPNGVVGRDINGAILSCESGVWRKSGGSTVLTGYISNGQQIPIPAGFAQHQCTWSVSNSSNPQGMKPNYFAGQLAFSDANRVVRCGFFDEYNFYPGSTRNDLTGQCAYIISCT